MKTIRIYTATTDNGGSYLPAGSAVNVGDAPGEIAEARAQAMIDEDLAAGPPRRPQRARTPVQPDHTSDEAE
ncbi:hypothetical protein J3454_14370 [Erythrobacter sp. NFXS35]|uniref:hypothetical protein n=1 Tax=Erythrobacter sp. NFXS35 TaxID=2818436 RepID=UPI0032DF6831